MIWAFNSSLASPVCSDPDGRQYNRESFVCLMGDVLLDPCFLPEAVTYLEANPTVSGVTGHVGEMNRTSLQYMRRSRRISPRNRIGSIDRMNGHVRGGH